MAPQRPAPLLLDVTPHTLGIETVAGYCEGVIKRNAAIPVTTSIGTQLGYLLGGAVLTETIFQWPGMGRYVVDAILSSDIKPLQASVLVVAVSFVLINLLVDLSYAWLDPRVGEGRQ